MRAVGVGRGKPQFLGAFLICRVLTIEEIEHIVRAMGDTAERLVTADADEVELHGHEGYFFDQFTSTAWNQRKDKC